MKKLIYLLVAAIVLSGTVSCHEDKAGENGVITRSNRFYTIRLDAGKGTVLGLEVKNEPLLHSSVQDQPMFTLGLRDRGNDGNVVGLPSSEAKEVSCRQYADSIVFVFKGFRHASLEATAVISFPRRSPDIHWNIRVEGIPEGFTLDYVDFPRIVVPDDLRANGGSGQIFWPAQEGCLIDDAGFRNLGGLTYQPQGWPTLGWGGQYPGSVQMQFMAYYNDKAGICLTARDASHRPKGFEYYKTDEGGVMLDLRLFTDGATGYYRLPYEIVTTVFRGDWYDAADIYRNWALKSASYLPPRIKDNKDLPEWYHDSPVIITYPVRGKYDLGDMTPNKLFPYSSAIPIIDRYASLFDSRIMALLMHWEGSAPWAPPYVWPPYGGEEALEEFIRDLHSKDNLIGLYGSGIGYTLRSNTDTTYNNYQEFKEKQLDKIMKVAPDGSLSRVNVCAGPYGQRLGWDMCPACDFVSSVVSSQIREMALHEVDYVQYFDQNLGGAAYYCYGDKEHNHPYGPGEWIIKAMKNVLDSCTVAAGISPRQMLIGCEAAAAEPFMDNLRFNDARATINLMAGIPVPAYAYVYHEYVNNFMGNQNQVSGCIDHEKSPYNLLQRLAYAFCAGDMFTVIIRDDGDMIWDWDGLWEGLMPSQEETTTLIRNLNAWRRLSGKDFLVYGRMERPMEISGDHNVPMYNKRVGRDMDFSSVFKCSWDYNGRKAGFLVNYLPEEQTVTLIHRPSGARVHTDPSDRKGTALKTNTVALAPLSAVMITY